MYRHTNKYQKTICKSYTNRKQTEQHLAETGEALPVQKIPSLRRVIEITDYDSGEPVVHKIELFRTDRIDCYDVHVDGSLWKKRIGWSQVLAGIRKAMPRLARE
ncbi:hypothetical protein [Paraglaciecola aestuariivivens]